jgi:hypothetical protein
MMIIKLIDRCLMKPIPFAIRVTSDECRQFLALICDSLRDAYRCISMVVGLGGLGHLAVKFAHALGAYVC